MQSDRAEPVDSNDVVDHGSSGVASRLVTPTRRKVLATLTRSGDPLDAVTIAQVLGLHVTTARFHLDQLEAENLVSRMPAVEKRRGRPRILYRVSGTARDEESREQLITVLAQALAAQESGDHAAILAGERWAEDFPAQSDDPALDLTTVLDRLGFAPEKHADTIRLNACPFRAAARAHPEVVCAVHRGLVQRVLDRAGSDVAGELIPFVEPELCLVQLASPGIPAGR